MFFLIFSKDKCIKKSEKHYYLSIKKSSGSFSNRNRINIFNTVFLNFIGYEKENNYIFLPISPIIPDYFTANSLKFHPHRIRKTSKSNKKSACFFLKTDRYT